jgi:hypothetical protein
MDLGPSVNGRRQPVRRERGDMVAMVSRRSCTVRHKNPRKMQPGEEKAALTWAAKQPSAQLMTKALISVAKGIARREQAEKEPQK